MRNLILTLSVMGVALVFAALCFPVFFTAIRDVSVMVAASFWGLRHLCEVQEFNHRATTPPVIKLEKTDVRKLYSEGRRLKIDEGTRKDLKIVFGLMRSAAEENRKFFEKWERVNDLEFPIFLSGLNEAEKVLLQEAIVGKITKETNRTVIKDLEFLGKFEKEPISELHVEDAVALYTFFTANLPVVQKPGKGWHVAYCNRVYHMLFSSFDPNMKMPKMSICQKFFRVPTRGEEFINSFNKK